MKSLKKKIIFISIGVLLIGIIIALLTAQPPQTLQVIFSDNSTTVIVTSREVKKIPSHAVSNSKISELPASIDNAISSITGAGLYFITVNHINKDYMDFYFDSETGEVYYYEN